MATFKARARTLEMLGKQQIAGIPTAINELFKNAHDAYSERVEVDYYRDQQLFILCDDGIGMTKDEFENKWLTLGTESKFDKRKVITDPKKEVRPVLGEKGIGRLAIASIGPQVLILTRAKFGQDKSLTMAFINWTQFEIPGIDLNEIIIPLKSYALGNFPSKNDVEVMVTSVNTEIEKLYNSKKVDKAKYKEITEQLAKFDVNPIYWEKINKNTSLLNNGSGTHFYLQPTDEMLEIELNIDDYEKEASKLQKLLIGFTNTMTKNQTIIKSAFRDHKTLETYTDLINEKAFFTPDDFNIADHVIDGIFDEYGKFIGDVKIYNNKPVQHVISWSEGNGKLTNCGPFKIKFGYVMYEARKTKLSAEDHTTINTKLEKMAGLYIYNDGIRILPYGDSDFDFLDIEKRRSKGLGYYFFSYRNMFGAIEIDRDNNYKLKEKAGREGFIQNKAYSDFRKILINFFIQLARDFFFKEGSQSDIFLKQAEEYKRLHEASKKRDEELLRQTEKLQTELENFFTALKNKRPNEDIEALYEDLSKRFDNLSEDEIKSTKRFLEIESWARDQLEKVKNKYTINRPKGYAIGKELRYDWEAYQEEIAGLEEKVFFPAKTNLENIATHYLKKYEIDIDINERLEKALGYTFKKIKATLKNEEFETKNILNKVSKDISNMTNDLLTSINSEIDETRKEFELLLKQNFDDKKLAREAMKIEEKLFFDTQKTSEIFQKLRSQLDQLILGKNLSGDYLTSADISEAMEEEILSLRERVDTDLELSQLGLAVGVIHHEFNHSVRSIRENIKRLKTWATKNEKLNSIYENIRHNFEHLDGYLTLFTPLNRRLYRKKVDINGKDIHNFLLDIFSERFRRHNIELYPSDEFNRKVIKGFPSTFYPVFVNIIDNAVFWLQRQKGERFISLDANNKGFSIENNGESINDRDKYRIFEMGFSRKPNGRGMGLAISKQVLEKEGYTIFIGTTEYEGSTVNIRIEKDDKTFDEEENE